jgi:predicted flap endonuclease-1-like 5' DNA nuclease
MSTSAIVIPLPVPSKPSMHDRVKQTDHTHPPFEIDKLAEPANESSQTSDRPLDDTDGLQRIKGIGQAFAQALNSLGIYRHADIVSFTPDSLADLLKAEIRSISPRRIARDDWIGQARALAGSHEKTESLQPEAHETTAPSAEGQEKDRAEIPRKDWRELADFFVSFGFEIAKDGEEQLKTRVHHSQADEPKDWNGIATEELINWMLSQAKLTLPVEPSPPETRTAARPVPVAPYDTQIKIPEVRVSEIPTLSGLREKKLVVDVRFQVSGPEAETLTAGRTRFRIEVHTVNLDSRASRLVTSEEGQLQPQVFEYASQHEFPVPTLGRHELHTIILLLPPGDMMVVHRGPTINVVP